MLNSTHHWYPINSSFFQTIPVHNQNTSPFWNPLYAIIHKYIIHFIAVRPKRTRAVPEWLCPLLSTLSLSFFPCLQKAGRIPRNHVGASRIAHVFRVFLFFYFSLSLRLPPLFLSQSFYFSRDSHFGRTGGGLEGEEDSLSLEDPADYTDVGLQARSVPRLSYTQRRKCWNSSGANSTTKDECRGCLDKSIISSARVVPVWNTLRMRVYAEQFGNCINSDNLYTLWNR